MKNWFKHDKERDRFYLLPGQGGRALQRKRRVFLIWSAVVGLVVAGALGFLIWWFDNQHR